MSFTSAGRERWSTLTRRVAERGRAQARPGETSVAAAQHVAIVLDHRVLVAPFIDYAQNPRGLHGDLQMAGGFTASSARMLVALLKSGALPARLAPA